MTWTDGEIASGHDDSKKIRRVFPMRLFRSARWLLLALLISLVPASSYAGVFISVGFAPPVLPIYVQPVCPEPGLMWTPGYWAYGADGYYWVPGAWVPSPYIGALWTPGYWGWSGGLYAWHGGYWGPHVGYYGGVNYGFGYGGIGFAGGLWRGGVFSYNTAVMHVGVGGGWGGHVYEDRVAVDRGFVARDSHVAFSGGPGGIHHDPSPEERLADHDQHRGPSDVQQHHAEAARADRTSYAKNNGGNPAHGGVDRPLGGESHGAVGGHGVGESHGMTAGGSHSSFAGGSHTSSTTTTHTSTMTTTHTASTGGSHAPVGGGSHPAPAAHAPSGGGGGGGKHK
jgi:hypothetical protein